MIRRHIVIERGGIRFGIFGVLGKEAQIYTSGGAVTFADPVETAREMVKLLRETEKVDVVIALSHGGVVKGKDGRYTDGEDVQLAKAVPGIDVVIGGHSHTELREAIIVNGRTPVVQAGKEGREPRRTGDRAGRRQADGRVLPASIRSTTRSPATGPSPARSRSSRRASPRPCSRRAATASTSRWRSRRSDLPNTFTDIAAGTLLANLCTDAFRNATKADIGFTANGMMRAGLTRGKSGVQTVYDVFAVAPLGAGVVDPTAGSALGDRLLHRPGTEAPARVPARRQPGAPRRVLPPRLRHAVPLRPVAPEVRRRDGHRARATSTAATSAIDISGKDERLYSLTCPLMLGLIIVAIPKYTKGKLPLVPKNKEGQPLTSKVEALDDPRDDTPDLLPPPRHDGQGQRRHAAGKGAGPRDQGVAGDHGSPAQPAGEERRASCR